MKNIFTWVLCSSLFCITAHAKEQATPAGIANRIANPDTTGTTQPVTVANCARCIVLAEQLFNRAAIVDLDAQQIIWEWRPAQSNVKPAHLKWFTNTSDVKPVYNGRYLLITASGGGVALVRIADKKTVFYAYAGGNTHSAELLPDGNIVSASSTGNYLTLFKVDTTQAPEQVYHRNYTVPFAHNVVWDQQRQVLWTAGMNKLLTFTYNFNCRQPALTLKDSASLPGTEAHDLFPVHGGNALWLTNTTHVYTVNPDTKQVTQADVLQKNIKSVSSATASLPVIIIRPKTSWWTDEVIDAKGKTVFHQNGLKIYKARWFINNPFSYPADDSMKQCR